MSADVLTMQLRRDTTEPARARRAIAKACADLENDLVATAQLLTSELVTNALEHGSGRIVLRLQRTEDHLRVEVSDQSHRMPSPGTRNIENHRGRGLAVVEAYSQSWGVTQLTRGKSVWFRLRAPRLPGAP